MRQRPLSRAIHGAGFDITGLDLSEEMLNKLKEKAPGAKVHRTDITEYFTEERFDYIFISSGSVSCLQILTCAKEL